MAHRAKRKSHKKKSHRGWFQRCVAHVKASAKKHGRHIRNPSAVCGALLRAKKAKRRRKH